MHITHPVLFRLLLLLIWLPSLVMSFFLIRSLHRLADRRRKFRALTTKLDGLAASAKAAIEVLGAARDKYDADPSETNKAELDIASTQALSAVEAHGLGIIDLAEFLPS